MEDVSDRLRQWGSRASLPEVKNLYAPWLIGQSTEGLECLSDLSYGTDPRHRLDVYRPAGAALRGAPVLVFFHGGGFMRGDKGDRANIGWWGASQGFVTVLANYRLAPAAVWPSGPQDVVSAWRCAVRNAEAWGGDPRRLFLMGESAGAAHVAAASLMRRFQPADWHVAGALLLSGPYDAGLEGQAPQALDIALPDLRNQAYFGADVSRWQEASIVEQIDASPFPLLLAAADWDLLQMKVSAGALFSRLVRQHGFAPQLHWWPQHNHFSPGFSMGTPDDSVSGPIADFVRRQGLSDPGVP